MTYEPDALAVDASKSLPSNGRDEFWSWQAVEDRLVEAMGHWWRSHDRDARFSLGGRISSIWRQSWTDRETLALIEQVDLPREAPKPLPLSRGDIARMDEASEWLRFVPEADRRLVVLALVKKAAGHSRVPWLKLRRALGVRFGADGLRMRYSRAITAIANSLNSAANRQGCMSSPQMMKPSK